MARRRRADGNPHHIEGAMEKRRQAKSSGCHRRERPRATATRGCRRDDFTPLSSGALLLVLLAVVVPPLERWSELPLGSSRSPLFPWWREECLLDFRGAAGEEWLLLRRWAVVVLSAGRRCAGALTLLDIKRLFFPHGAWSGGPGSLSRAGNGVVEEEEDWRRRREAGFRVGVVVSLGSVG